MKDSVNVQLVVRCECARQNPIIIGSLEAYSYVLLRRTTNHDFTICLCGGDTPRLRPFLLGQFFPVFLGSQQYDETFI
jgi:hypothetical protein